jgi:hypothetical protein
MSPSIVHVDPEFDHTTRRLVAITWFASCGKPLPDSLADWCSVVSSAQQAMELLESDSWEAWSLGLQNELTGFLDRAHRARYVDWNRIAQRAKAVLLPLEPAIARGLNSAGLVGAVALDTVRWDVVGALTCAGFMDCKPPAGSLKLIDVYEAGHMPVGWSADDKRVLVY